RPGLCQLRDVADVDLRQRREAGPREVVVVRWPFLRRRRPGPLRILCGGESADEERGSEADDAHHRFKPARILAYNRSYIASLCGSGDSLISPMIMGSAAAPLRSGQGGRPVPFGLPVRAKFTQYDDIVWASARSVADADAISGELASGKVRGAPSVLKTY